MSDPPLSRISRFVVLMLENRSFDHLLGTHDNPLVDGIANRTDCINYPDPLHHGGTPVRVEDVAALDALGFDPPHEFPDVQRQIFGPDPGGGPGWGPPDGAEAMTGFLLSARDAAAKAGVPEQAAQVMQCFAPQQIPVITALARQGAIFNYWFSSLPGPTFPNRYFVHAATSGGLTESPTELEMAEGYEFKAGTIFQALHRAGHRWRIYHDGLPNTASIHPLTWSFIDIFTTDFREFSHFAADVRHRRLPEYTFIEPAYDTGNQFLGGNSMHARGSVRRGEELIRRVYETLFDPTASDYWRDTMLVVTFDEHGGFFDHVRPPAAPPTGDDSRYRNPNRFAFDRYGVRVPAIAVSAWTRAGTVIGLHPSDSDTIFDHSSIPATLEKRFGLRPLTARDAQANTLEAAINLAACRTDLPRTLAGPA